MPSPFTRKTHTASVAPSGTVPENVTVVGVPASGTTVAVTSRPAPGPPADSTRPVMAAGPASTSAKVVRGEKYRLIREVIAAGSVSGSTWRGWSVHAWKTTSSGGTDELASSSAIRWAASDTHSAS